MAPDAPDRRTSRTSWRQARQTSPASTRRSAHRICERVQHFLHSQPGRVPLIVLVLLADHLRPDLSERQVLLGLHADADPAAGRDRRHHRRGPDAGHPDRRHRPFGRRHHGAVLGGHGPVRLPLRPAGRAGRSSAASVVGALCGFINGVLVAYMKLPPFIVTLGTWQIVLATNFLYSANETIRAQDIEASAPLLQFFGKPASASAVRSSPMASSSMILLVVRALVRAQPHRLGPPSLCRRRRSRSGEALRRQTSSAC